MLEADAEFFRLDHRPARQADDGRTFDESWMVRLLIGDDFVDAPINDPEIAAAFAKLPKRSRIHVTFSIRAVRDVWNALRLTIQSVDKPQS